MRSRIDTNSGHGRWNWYCPAANCCAQSREVLCQCGPWTPACTPCTYHLGTFAQPVALEMDFKNNSSYVHSIKIQQFSLTVFY